MIKKLFHELCYTFLQEYELQDQISRSNNEIKMKKQHIISQAWNEQKLKAKSLFQCN